MTIAIPPQVFRDAHEAHAQLCDEADEVEVRRDFDAEDVHSFIADFSKCDGDAAMWLEDRGIHKTCIASAELLRAMSRAYVANPLAVYGVAGLCFWQEMRKLAYEAWSANL